MAEIPLLRGGVTLVDDEDYERLSQYLWRLSYGYVVRSVRGPRCGECGRVRSTSRRMHHDVFGLPPAPTLFVDHRNGDPLDNRKANLRWATRVQNQGNLRARRGGTSRYKGVSLDHDGRWIATCAEKYLGRFDSEAEAAVAYNVAALGRWGDFAKPNEVQ